MRPCKTPAALRRETIYSWLFLIVTAITGGFIAWQAWETKRAAKAAAASVEAINRQAKIMERQTVATEKAADAALVNAQAVIASERPWLTVIIRWNSSVKGQFFYRAINVGRTPAEFISGESNFTFRDRPDDLPVPPEYSGAINAPERTLIATDDEFDIQPGMTPEAIIKNADMEERIRIGNQFLLFVWKDHLQGCF